MTDPRPLPPARDYHLIVFFPDYGASSPLWWEGSTDPRSFGLTPELARDLEAWAAIFDRSDPDGGWPTGFDPIRYEKDGDDLARRVAEALGFDWAVERVTSRGGQPFRYIIRSTSPAADPAAARKAEKLAAAAQGREERLRRRRESGARIDYMGSYRPSDLDGTHGTRES